MEKKKGDREVNDPIEPIANTCEFCSVVCTVSSAKELTNKPDGH